MALALAYSLNADSLLTGFSLLVNNDMLFIPTILVIAALLNKRALYFVIAAIVLVLVLKPLIAEPRPCFASPSCETDYGFPSGHTTLAAALAFSQLRRKHFTLLLLLALLVAYSRVYLGLHSLSQVAAGFALAALLLEVDRLLGWTCAWSGGENLLIHLRYLWRRYSGKVKG